MLKAMQYTVRADSVEANKTLVSDFVSALEARGHVGVYLSTHIQGTSTFVHVLDPNVGQVLHELPEFAAFQQNLSTIMVDGPRALDVNVVAGSLNTSLHTPQRA